jgi:hypothetical protein
MTPAAVARALDSEGNAQHSVGTYRHSQHEGHGCCQDAQEHGGGRTLVGIASDGSARALVLPVRCKSWRCTCCAVALRRRARARAFQGASGSRVAMLTLTIDRSDDRYADPANRAGKPRPRAAGLLGNPRAVVVEESTRYASWAWNRFRTYLTREHGRVAYFRALELQESGVAHLHVVIRFRDLAEVMRLQALIGGSGRLAVRAGFGPVVHLTVARSGGDVARYVTKVGRDVAAYVTKGTSRMSLALPRYTRRASWSLGSAAWAPDWTPPTPIGAGFTWQLAAASAATVRTALVLSDFILEDPARYRVPASGGVRDGAR